MKRRISLILISCFLLTLLCGCGLFRPQNAEALMEKVSEVENGSNFHMEGAINMNLSMTAEGATLDAPIDILFEGDANGDDSHVTSDLSMTAMGQTQTMSVETYSDGRKLYQKDEESGSWKYKDSVGDSFTNTNKFVEHFIEAGIFENADMEFSDDTYTVTVDMKEFNDEKNIDAIFNLSEVVPSGTGVDYEPAFENGSLVYTIDSDFYLQSLEMEGVSSDTFEMNMVIEMSDYGEIDEDDVVVPSDVTDTATSVDDDTTSPEDDENVGATPPKDNASIDDGMMVDPSDDISGNSTPSNTVPDNAIPDTGVGSEESTTTGTTPPTGETTGSQAPSSGSTAVTSDILGSYNGQPLYPGTFTADLFLAEFTWDSSELEQYSFVPLYGIDNRMNYLYLYDKDGTGTETGIMNAVYGYEFEVLDVTDTNSLPNVTFGGLTWGASIDQVMSVYGTDTDSSYIGDDFWTIEYDISNQFSDGGLYLLRFSGTNEGVSGFSLNHFN